MFLRLIPLIIAPKLHYMKQLMLAFVIFLSFNSSAQEDVLATVAQKVCACTKEKQIDINDENTNTQLGLCIVEAAKPYSEQIKDQYNLDFSNLNGPEGEKLGELVGFKMLSFCPEFFENYSETESRQETGYVSGEVIRLDKDRLLTFHVKGTDGKIYKLLWQGSFDGDAELIYNYDSLKGQKVYFDYVFEEYFDPRINEYIPFRIITGYSKIEDE